MDAMKRLLIVGGIAAALLLGHAAPASAYNPFRCSTRIVIGTDGVERRVTFCRYGVRPRHVVGVPIGTRY